MGKRQRSRQASRGEFHAIQEVLDAASEGGPDSYSIVSLADPVFALAQSTTGYVTLIVNVNPNLISYSGGLPTGPVGIAFDSGSIGSYTVTSTPAFQGAGPIQPLTNHLELPHPQNQKPYFTAWVNTFSGGAAADPYAILDLTQFGDFYSSTPGDNNAACSPAVSPATGIVCSSNLVLTLRSTMLGTDDNGCSVFAVPYNTAEYTNYKGSDGYSGGGFMGPYAPLLDYPPVGSLSYTGTNRCLAPPSFSDPVE